MFQNEAPKNTVAIELTRTDGVKLAGKIVVPYGSDLVRVLNSGTRYFEFEDMDGTVRFIAKDAVVELVEAKSKKPPKLHSKILDETENAHKVLNVREGASHEEVRSAYARLVKRYHPDQYAAVELPDEVKGYMTRMFEHISLAYQSVTRRTETVAAE